MKEKYEKLMEDQAFWEKLYECEDKGGIAALFAGNGITLEDATLEEWVNFMEEHRNERKLTEDQLEGVAGGFYFRRISGYPKPYA